MIDYRFKYYTKAALVEKIKQLEEELDNKDLELANQMDAYADLENKIDEIICKDIDYDTLVEIIEHILNKAEDWDYGIQGWQKLETKQDLINELRKAI